MKSDTHCRKAHREEMIKVQQQLKSSSAASKGGAAEAEKTKKELEKLREKLQAAEAKCRGLVQEKNQAVQEKGNFEREIKQLRGTTGRLTKVWSAIRALSIHNHAHRLYSAHLFLDLRHAPLHVRDT